MKTMKVLAGLVLAAVATVPTAAFAATSPTPTASTTQSVDGITVTSSLGIETASELDAFLLSDTPKTVTVHAETGKIVSVGEAPSFTPAPLTTVTSICKTGNACLVSSKAPYADYGFSGVGTSTGTWAHRIEWKTGDYTAKAWYTYKGATVGWGGVFGPNSDVKLDGEVTAVKVTIYS